MMLASRFAGTSDPIKGASIVRDIDFGFGFADNQPFLTHRSFNNR